MKRMIVLCVAALLVTSCTAAKIATQPVDMTTVSKGAYAARSAYEGLLILAVAYNQRPPCGQPTSPVVCRNAEVVLALRKASEVADTATGAAEQAVRRVGVDPSVAQAAVVAAQSSVEAFKKITDIYSPKQ